MGVLSIPEVNGVEEETVNKEIESEEVSQLVLP